MNDEEAVTVAERVANLWPTTPLAGERLTFYARALRVLPDCAAAIRAVEALFLDERWQPTPGQVIDRCLDVDGGLALSWEQVKQAAVDHAARRPMAVRPGREAVAALAACGHRVADLPVGNAWQLEQVRQRFVDAYRAEARRALTPLPPAPHVVEGAAAREIAAFAEQRRI